MPLSMFIMQTFCCEEEFLFSPLPPLENEQTKTLFISVWTHGFLFCSMCYNPLLSLFWCPNLASVDPFRVASCFFFFFFFVFCLFVFLGPHLQHMGSSQSRGHVWATAAGVRHSHSNSESEWCLWPASQLTATLDP